MKTTLASPRYLPLRACGAILTGLGWIAIVPGILLLMAAAIAWAEVPPTTDSSDPSELFVQAVAANKAWSRLTPGIALSCAGLACLVLGLLVELAVDIAKNVYRQAICLEALSAKASLPNSSSPAPKSAQAVTHEVQSAEPAVYKSAQ